MFFSDFVVVKGLFKMYFCLMGCKHALFEDTFSGFQG